MYINEGGKSAKVFERYSMWKVKYSKRIQNDNTAYNIKARVFLFPFRLKIYKLDMSMDFSFELLIFTSVENRKEESYLSIIETGKNNVECIVRNIEYICTIVYTILFKCEFT